MTPTRFPRRPVAPAAFRALVALVVAVAFAPASAAAQGAADSLARAEQARAQARRANWLSDRMPLAVGDLVTVLVDEQAQASEKVARLASGERSLATTLDAALAGSSVIDPSRVLSGFGAKSNDTGSAIREGDLVAVITTRVTALEAGGVVRIAGTKTVKVDGRAQEIAVSGVVRAEDVDSRNRVSSGRIAEAMISYKGKAIGPRTGILGGILKMLWP